MFKTITGFSADELDGKTVLDMGCGPGRFTDVALTMGTRVIALDYPSAIETAQVDFNERLRRKKIPTGRWKTGANLVDRMLGKELCVLAWAAEHAAPAELPTICSKWSALRPEERWWLFAMTVAEAGQPEDRDRGWRKALYYALADGQAASPSKKRRRPLEADLATLPLFETAS